MPWWEVFLIVNGFIWVYSISISIAVNWDEVKNRIEKKIKFLKNFSEKG